MDEKPLLKDRGSEALMPLFKEKLEVKRLKSKDIAQTSKTLLDPAILDPLSESIRETPETHPKWYGLIERARFPVFASQWARRKWGLTINHGQAVISVLPCPENIRMSKLDMAYIYAARALDFIGKSKQQRKVNTVPKSSLGSFLLLKTSPALSTETRRSWEDPLRSHSRLIRRRRKQNVSHCCSCKGIGCDALVSAESGRRQRAIDIRSCNESTPHGVLPVQGLKGFECVAETFIGKNDPTWDRSPVEISLMFRPYKEY
ncbi:hypothetical protein ACEPAI_5737 [Sanghuangporus weigelae]